MNYTDDIIDHLFQIQKVFFDPPPKDYREDRGHMKKNFTLQSEDGQFNFKGFIRYNIRFPENFSVGLDYDPRDEKGTICLLRCNGDHGENNVFPHHATFHIHRASASTINEGLKPESNIEPTSEYSGIDEAIQFYVGLINIDSLQAQKYFPPKQLTLFGENE